MEQHLQSPVMTLADRLDLNYQNMEIDWRSVKWSGLLPLLAAGFGWLLSEWGHVIRLHRDERRAIGRVLSDLIIIHRHLIAIKALSDKFRAHTKFTEQQHLQLAMEAFFPSTREREGTVR